MILRAGWLTLILFTLTACESTYYNAWEKLGVHKRDILIDRIEDVQDAQQDGKEQFSSALEQFRAIVNVEGGDLAKTYDRLNREYEDSVAASERISERIDKVESVAEALFKEWEQELELYNNARLRSDSRAKLAETRNQYKNLLAAMRNAERSIQPVLTIFSDNVLYLKHNLNARAISSLRGELSAINNEVNQLLNNMQQSISASEAFINQLKQP